MLGSQRFPDIRGILQVALCQGVIDRVMKRSKARLPQTLASELIAAMLRKFDVPTAIIATRIEFDCGSDANIMDEIILYIRANRLNLNRPQNYKLIGLYFASRVLAQMEEEGIQNIDAVGPDFSSLLEKAVAEFAHSDEDIGAIEWVE